ncbi:growth arrest-specific protein 2-like [Tachypleus tridentatus]|uniref:growth arrest-specific protein 2-like n=1 Tax=Tachypleus tridentatus TaxID=6853 RepID=UPI003FD10C94
MLFFDMLIYDREKELLVAQKQVLAQWINRTLGIDDVTLDNFMHILDNGVILCKIAKLVQHKAEQCCMDGLIKGVVPPMKFKCWENAKSESFFARDNTENFLKWCRNFGVNEAVIFESDGLVRHTQPRNVVLCLLELGRLATRFGIPPPALVKLEKEIDDQDYGTASETESVSSVSSPSRMHSRTDSTMSVTSVISPGPITAPPTPSPIQKCSVTPIRNRTKLSELDKKVLQITAKVLRDGSQIKKISDGRYTIGGKNIFVRLLKENHIVVRVGGGWDTLEHFLSHHDSHQIKTPQKSTAAANGRTPSSTPAGKDAGSQRTGLQSKTKYRSPFLNVTRSPKYKHS